MAEEKQEKEDREKKMAPRKRDWEKEHGDAVKASAEKAFFEDGRVRQCNEGKVPFGLDEDRTHVCERKRCVGLTIATLTAGESVAWG